jgi:hypothetical protein
MLIQCQGSLCGLQRGESEKAHHLGLKRRLVAYRQLLWYNGTSNVLVAS